MLRNRYLIDLGEGSGPIPWDPREESDPVRLDCIFFGRALLELERRLRHGGRTVVLTWDVEGLPVRGPDVVAVVLGDEASRRPRYAEDVEAIFKCYGDRPWISTNMRRAQSRLGALILLEDVRRRARALPDDLTVAVRRVAARAGFGRDAATIHRLPLGYYNQVDLPVAPFESRETTVFFAGSIDVPSRSPGVLGRIVEPPRMVARRQMLAALERFRQEHPKERTEVRLTPGFSSVTRARAPEYSQALMDARICLAPRGGSVETFRFFEALRYGCVVVSEPLPPTWFYTGAPIVTIEDWRTLPEVLDALIDNPEMLVRRHEASLVWWQHRCSPEAVARYMAEQLNAQTPPA